ncbi:hypothetical protein A0O28_0029590 [Trichoderma guizhouense]|uniref:Fumarylacetoacetate hydrolase n=1 Tax=Trichoderma guizhouense TaxID=1491466 RepID=A0A1T3CU76_9HYPO|nr:hypothetical protein A0O28_0029590 [Trichoderma guizhouense]
MSSSSQHLTNYAAFTRPETGITQIGHLDAKAGTIQPLSLLSGYPIKDLYQVIEAGPSQIVASGSALSLSSVKILAPLVGRDVLAVGKNYMEHAKEFNASGYDSSDKVDKPSHPVIFTKRATSIIADDEDIYLHPEFSKSVDYEGEIGVIVGKAGFRIPKEQAMDYVWGYTIINDMTARERQRDHKQFYIGKSADTFCPMGPVAVPKEALPSVLRVQTHVNGELRQDATTDDLIFDIPTLINTLSEGQTLLPGDVIATGTPAGVGIGRNPPIFLKEGDEITVTIPGIGALHNRVTTVNATTERLASQSVFNFDNAARSLNGTAGLTIIDRKPLHYKRLGLEDKSSVVFVHGLGETSEYFSPLIANLELQKKANVHLFDFEGHGLSPTHPLSVLSVDSLAEDLEGVFEHAGLSESNPGTLIASSFGCLIAIKFVLYNPRLVNKLVLMFPPHSPLSEHTRQEWKKRGELVRTLGMGAVVDDIISEGTTEQTRSTEHVAMSAVRLSLLGQDPESFAKACDAFAKVDKDFPLESLDVKTLLISGGGDDICSQGYRGRIRGARVEWEKDLGRWAVFENVRAVSDLLTEFGL